ncbi:MAG: hypothetical protein IPJ41_18335 [Phycisphaerales bacterium]|nr:hypothetical protein [Phycisphaerales bacterium]
MPAIVLRACAKLNLALALGGPEPAGSARAGWHPICTWMHAIDLADDVLIEPLGPEGVSTWSAAWAPDAPRVGLIDWGPERDLAWRALRALESQVGRRLPTRIALRKRIPAGGGLGGGSSDAAAALLGIDRAWGLGLGEDRLRALGLRLGSDVPFFIESNRPPLPAIVSGFGETIERTRRVAAEAVLVIPPFGCPTGAVYRAFDAALASGSGDGRMRGREVRALADAAGIGRLFNDLEAPAFAVRPGLAEMRARASAALGREVWVTGSGSTLFTLYGPGGSGSAESRLRAALPGAAVVSCRLV